LQLLQKVRGPNVSEINILLSHLHLNVAILQACFFCNPDKG
jgi:hypothetical protein